jgi:DNA replication factor GINS
MPEETITFELIRKIHREEQESPKLTKLPENFYENLALYLEQKRKISAENRKVALELKNVKALVEDIFNRRERKIINQAIIAARTKIPPENLTQEEKEFFEVLVKTIEERRKRVLEEILTEKKEEKKEENLVVFKEDFPEFVGSDEKVYGPFKKGDIAKIPEENLKILKEKGIVEEFKPEK